MTYARNDFAAGLLSYSKEGEFAISLPERWTNVPPLFGATPLTEEMEAFANRLADQGPPEWYFLVGAPGNGKSEAVGALRRRLGQILLERTGKDSFLGVEGTGGGDVVRRYEVPLPSGRTLVIVQDATVPESMTSDPADDLLATLQSASENDLTSVIVCANRGVLEKSHRKSKGIVQSVLGWVATNSSEEVDRPPEPFAFPAGVGTSQMTVRVWPLDHESVLYGQASGDANPWADPTGSVLDNLLRVAIAEPNWEKMGCDECEARLECPFLLDAQWLRDDRLRRNFLKVLRRAEVSSGHRLVFREALNLLALVLVGSRHDFGDRHPCEWAEFRHREVLAGTDVGARAGPLLSLTARRIYMDLFGRLSPAGFELGIGGADTGFLRTLSGSPPFADFARAIKQVDSRSTKDCGMPRMFGENGVLTELDPARCGHGEDLAGLDQDSPAAEQAEACANVLSGKLPSLEERFFELAHQLEGLAASLRIHEDAAKLFGALNRWTSGYSARLAGLALAVQPGGRELDLYTDLLGAPMAKFTFLNQIRDLEQLLSEFCSPGGQTRYEVASGLTVLLGPLFVDVQQSSPRRQSSDPKWPASDQLAIELSLQSTGGSPRAVRDTISGKTFSNLVDTGILGLERWCLPAEIHQLFERWVGSVAAQAGATRKFPLQAEYKAGALDFKMVAKANSLAIR